ncbi:MAG: glutamine--fructose-6-phosphate transaminase (isomerizing) [Candidatus Enteromonas sp.]|nr:glutamine--fructose-6-phosphate transaminase (isomerizing) [Candidatus Enteromonas sp.]
MCGIVGGVGHIELRSYLLKGLKSLDYRGYDSAGLAVMRNGEVYLSKVMGRVEALDAATEPFSDASVGIAHTRWATHGAPSVVNAHPHVSQNGLFTIVHNGVIENFRALKKQLEAHHYRFVSETDTEVIANLLERMYLSSGNVLEAIRSTMDALEGSYACAILYKNEPNRLYFMKNASPLLVGLTEDASYLASDAVPMIEFTSSFVDLNDLDYGYLTPGKISLHHGYEEIAPTFTERSVDLLRNDLDGFPHYMLKEIHEIPSVLHRLRDNYFDGDQFLFDPELIETLRKAKKVHFLACGTSFFACKLGVKYFRYLGKVASASIASEWAYDPYDVVDKPVFILLSQSGETADLIRCQKIINEQNGISIAVTNTKGSTIERKATYSCLLYAGLEVAVASTKSYLAQAAFLAMLVGAIEGKTKVIVHLSALIDAVKDIIARQEEVHAIASTCTGYHDAFFVGRGHDYLGALEGALKLKEVSYIHAEAYQGGELKHGPIALIDENVLVIGFDSDPSLSNAIRNNLEELRARNGNVFVISTKATRHPNDTFVTESCKPHFATLPLVVFAQLFTYYVALEKGLPIDKPRNLAKSVTVE